MATENVILKLSYAGETRCVTVPLRSDEPKNDLSYELVLVKVRETFPNVANTQWTLVYRDEEGDVVTLSHALEFDEACQVLLQLNAKSERSLHFYVLQRVSLREKLVAPVMQKLLELANLAREATSHLCNSEMLSKGRESFVRLAGGAVAQAGAAVNHIRSSDVVGRGRESLGNSAVQTRTMLLSARNGLRRASSAVVTGIDRHRSSSGSSLDKTDAFDPTVFVKPSPNDLSPSPASEIVDLRSSTSSINDSAPAETAVEEDEEPPALVPAQSEQDHEPATVYESDTDTLCDEEEDRDWNIVGARAE